jgi:hypothetical protein
VLPEPGVPEMNLTLGSSCPTYQPLSMNRLPLPLTTLIGSVHSAPASFLTVPYFLLQPLQSSSLTGLGATVPGARAALATVEAPAVAAAPAHRRGPASEPC